MGKTILSVFPFDVASEPLDAGYSLLLAVGVEVDAGVELLLSLDDAAGFSPEPLPDFAPLSAEAFIDPPVLPP
jgi:hypothetical protein